MKPVDAGRRARALVVALALLVLAVPAAWAEPWHFERDKSDNDYYFTFDASVGTITKAYSSARFHARDKVDFFVYVRERVEAPPGERLVGRLELSLNKDKVVVYDGTFRLDIRSSMTGDVVYTVEREERIRLRPRKGERKATLKFLFDLPSGDYSAKGFFSI